MYALGGTLYFALTTHEPPSVSARNTSLQQGQQDLPSLQQRLASNPPEDAADPQRHFRLGVSKPQKPAPRHSRHLAQLGSLPPPLLEQLNRIITRAMALRPDKRYQSVAEMSNDLKKVLAALPVSHPQPVPPRQVDPHSTQPDLQQLYEAVQAAKEQAAHNADPPAQVKPTVTCPRCGAIITDTAAYCRVCGTPLPPQGGNTPPSGASTSSNQSAQNPSMPKQASSFDDRALAEEETMEIQPQKQARRQHSPGLSAPPSVLPPASQTHTSHYSPDFPQPSGNGATAPSSPPSAQMVLPSPQMPNTHHTASGQQSANKRPAARAGLPVWLFLLVVILLLVLVAVLLLLLTHHSTQDNESFLASIGVFYERNAVVTAAPAPSWLWACCAGIAATAGFSR